MVYIFMADGFEDLEALSVVDILRRGGIDVTTVGAGSDYPKSAHGVFMKADINEKDFKLGDDCAAIVLPGGMPGAENLEASPVVQQALTEAFQKGIIIAAICAAPFILAHRGFLDGKKAAIYPSFKDEVGKSYTADRVVKDGNIITACGPGAAIEFALALLKEIKNEDAAKLVARDALIIY